MNKTASQMRINAYGIDLLQEMVHKASDYSLSMRIERQYAELFIIGREDGRDNGRKVSLTVTKCEYFGVPSKVLVERFGGGEKQRKVTMTAQNAAKAAAEWMAA